MATIRLLFSAIVITHLTWLFNYNETK